MNTLVATATMTLGIMLPLSPSSGWKDATQGYAPTFSFLPAGVYELGEYRGMRVRLFSQGPRAEDVLTVCNLFPSELGDLAHRMCASPASRDSASVFAATYDPGSSDWTPGVQLLREVVVAQALPVDAAPNPTLQIQPPKGWAFTGVDTIAYLQVDPGALTTPFVVAGLEGSVTWQVAYVDVDFGQGPASVVRSGNLGAAYPDQTITYAYTKPGVYQPQATITWNATATVNGQTFHFDKATTTTTTYHQTLTAKKPHATFHNPNNWNQP